MKRIFICMMAVCALALGSCSGGNEPETSPTEAVTEEETVAEVGIYTDSDEDFLSYEDGLRTTEPGIDVSSYSGDINWKKVAAAGVKNAMIRLGGRGYGEEGVLYADEKALENIKEAKKYGIKVGGYFYSQAISRAEAAEEARYAVDLLGGEKLELPIAYDFENIDDDDARTDKVKETDVQKLAESFCKTISESGYEAIVYGYTEDFETKYKADELKYSSGIWVAEYENYPDIDDNIRILQYSNGSSLSGIEGTVDLDMFVVKK